MKGLSKQDSIFFRSGIFGVAVDLGRITSAARDCMVVVCWTQLMVNHAVGSFLQSYTCAVFRVILFNSIGDPT